MNNRSFSGSEWILATLALILVGISFWQTAIGLGQIFGPASWPIAFVLSALLLYITWIIRLHKINKKSTNGLLAGYCFVAIFCFVANFNALYSRFMRRDILNKEIKNVYSKSLELQTQIDSKLSYPYRGKEQQINILRGQLREQILNKGALGIGDKSLQIIDEINRLLAPNRLTMLSLRGANYQALADDMDRQIDGIIKRLPPEEESLKSEYSRFMNDFESKFNNYNTLSKKAQEEVGQDLVDFYLKKYNEMGLKAQRALKGMVFETMISRTDEVGKIGYAFRSAFVDEFDMYTVVTLFGCILLDFLLPFIVLLTTQVTPFENTQNVQSWKKGGGGPVMPNFK